MDLLIKNIKQLASPIGNKAKKGKDMGKLSILKHMDILVKNSIIEQIGHNLELPEDFEGHVIAADDLVATPGFIDPHTHIPFYGFRHDEFFMRQQGLSYMEIMQKGGGIVNTTKAVRKASLNDLIEFNLKFANEMFRKGVVAFEGKSGYGLDTDSEIKQLKALEKIEELGCQKVVKTFLGPHALAPEFTSYDSYLRMIIDGMLPQVRKAFEGELFADIFTEDGVFTAEQSRRYLEAALKNDFKIRLHADEIKDIGGSSLAGELNANSADHLICIKEESIAKLANSQTIATLLPGTSFFLGKSFAPARKLIDSGAAVALASDFNPGSCTINDPTLIAHLASSQLKMTPEEIITAMTLNAAAVINLETDWGTLEAGKYAGIVLWEIPDYTFIPYFPAHHMIHTVISPKKALRVKACL
ncbi:MAG TPA: imidazolonepropionase [Thermotogota bacterium]|nr:imidazolonepropionase [Thermotogota bacterium]HRW34554.1 imidazolonepropionase [Thermotogota bacterium]